MPKLKFRIHYAYGRTRLYPDCNISSMLCIIAGKKTLDEDDLKLIKEQGWEVELTTPSLPEL